MPPAETDPERAGRALIELLGVMGVLRLKCPWDRAQTHASLRRHVLEETYETLDALDRIAAAPQAGLLDESAVEDLREELGDLLFQIVFHAHLATESGSFDLADVIDGVRVKLVARHPGIYPDSGDGADPAESHVATQNVDWERAKLTEKGRTSVMDGIPQALPALVLATKVALKAEVVAPTALEEFRGGTVPGSEAELGRELLETVLAGCEAGLDAEAALRTATRELEAAVRADERPAQK